MQVCAPVGARERFSRVSVHLYGVARVACANDTSSHAMRCKGPRQACQHVHEDVHPTLAAQRTCRSMEEGWSLRHGLPCDRVYCPAEECKRDTAQQERGGQRWLPTTWQATWSHVGTHHSTHHHVAPLGNRRQNIHGSRSCREVCFSSRESRAPSPCLRRGCAHKGRDQFWKRNFKSSSLS